jgi:8-oxo-dGTP pyrophosphatase MutT (NUDIX family)
VAHHGRVTAALRAALAIHRPADPAEAADLTEVVAMVDAVADPASRHEPLHVTASALVVHPATGRVLLRWHAKQERWLQVGGHFDPGEDDPWLVALREAEEETGLVDLRPLVDGLFQVTIVDVAPTPKEPPHRHADLRYLLATDRPDDVPALVEDVPLRWCSLDEALALADEGLERLLRRVPGLR